MNAASMVRNIALYGSALSNAKPALNKNASMHRQQVIISIQNDQMTGFEEFAL